MMQDMSSHPRSIFADQHATSPEQDQEELALRRRLLFHLLQHFDFDKPDFHYETITSPMPIPAECEQADQFFWH
jgi:hypothetical protein